MQIANRSPLPIVEFSAFRGIVRYTNIVHGIQANQPSEFVFKEALKMIHKLDGANMDIDMATIPGAISWEQDACPWNQAEETLEHRCALKNISICPYFCGVEYLDTLLCCYPEENPYKQANR